VQRSGKQSGGQCCEQRVSRSGGSRLRLREDSKDAGQTSRRQAVLKPRLRRQSASTGSVAVWTPIRRRRELKRAWWSAACQNFIRKAVQVHNSEKRFFTEPLQLKLQPFEPDFCNLAACETGSMASGNGAGVGARLPRARIARNPHAIDNMSANRFGPQHVTKWSCGAAALLSVRRASAQALPPRDGIVGSAPAKGWREPCEERSGCHWPRGWSCDAFGSASAGWQADWASSRPFLECPRPSLGGLAHTQWLVPSWPPVGSGPLIPKNTRIMTRLAYRELDYRSEADLQHLPRSQFSEAG